MYIENISKQKCYEGHLTSIALDEINKSQFAATKQNNLRFLHIPPICYPDMIFVNSFTSAHSQNFENFPQKARKLQRFKA